MDRSGARGARPQIVIIGAGYAGYHCARGLERRLPAADIVIISPTDYMPYLSLLPEVGAGIVDPRHIAVSLPATLRHARLVPGHAIGADLVNRSVTVAGPDGERREVGWDRLVIAPGSVSRTLRLPGVLDHAKGFKNLAEALYLRDHEPVPADFPPLALRVGHGDGAVDEVGVDRVAGNQPGPAQRGRQRHRDVPRVDDSRADLGEKRQVRHVVGG